jgi:Flp pilus assembly protein TadG
MKKSREPEKGAAAVEFALVAPILLALLLGIIQFGYVFFMQISMTQAARTAVRSMVVENNQTTANTRALANVVGLTAGNIHYSPASCPTGPTGTPATITVTVTYTVNALGTLLPLDLTGKASMQCGG